MKDVCVRRKIIVYFVLVLLVFRVSDAIGVQYDQNSCVPSVTRQFYFRVIQLLLCTKTVKVLSLLRP